MKFINVGKNELDEVIQLLKEADLPVSDISLSNNLQLYALKNNNNLIAVCGLEMNNNEALLRSFVVKSNFRSNGIGKNIYNHTIKQAKNNKVNNLVLLTTTAKEWFLNQGWKIIDRNSVSNALASSQEFSTICPQNAICMQLKLV